MVVISNVFGSSDLEVLNRLPEVLTAQSKLITSPVVYFQASVPDTVKQRLLDTLGLDLFGINRVPFRWIRGDTKPHIDRGSSSFEDTYLVYLTDAEGQFHIGDESYDMNAGSGFVFSEGLSHEVTGTNGTSRLLLGPMSEAGFAVGEGNVINGGDTDTIYISQSGNDFYYRINEGENTPFSFPIGISNLNPEGNPLKIFFTTDLTFNTSEGNPGSNGFFIVSSNSIQFGDTTVKPDGTKYTITLDGITNYSGLINNSGYSNILVYNLNVVAINGSTLVEAGGWIGQTEYGRDGTNNFIIGCSSNGDIPAQGGGIVGSFACRILSGDTSDLSIIGCSTSGNIGAEGGGIAGKYAAFDGNLYVYKCSSSGSIGDEAGGIVGSFAGTGIGISNVTITKCYSNGPIGGDYAGGIAGRFAGSGSENFVEILASYSIGSVAQTTGGGIYGANAAPSGGNASAFNCYSAGNLANTQRGIFGITPGGNASQTNCYVANGTWVDNDANTTLANVQEVWISSGAGTPYLLRDFGPSPYNLITIGDEDMWPIHYEIRQAGASSDPGVLSGYSAYSILSGGHPTITINSTTGVISTTTETPVNTYILTVFAGGIRYSVSTFNLTVLTPPTPPPPSPSVQSFPTRGKSFDFETYNSIEFGRRLIQERLQNTNLRFKSFEDYMKYKKAFPSFT